jgi:hypothetical protein
MGVQALVKEVEELRKQVAEQGKKMLDAKKQES